MSIYTDNGYDSRKDYLNSLSDDYGIEIETVYVIADMLGPIEDFDGLVSTLQDMDYMDY